MESNRINYINLTWDSEYFQIPSAKVVLNEKLLPDDIKDINDFCKDYKFITIVNKDNDDINNRLIIKTGAYLTDVNIEFIKTNILPANINPYIKIINCYHYDKSIENLALVSFKYSRFYNVPKLNAEKCRKIYAEWVNNSFNKTDKFFCIYEEEGSCKGFLLFHKEYDKVIIELIAIDSKYSGKGIGSKLISALENFSYENKINTIQVGTQINNITAQNFYSKCGFKINKISSIYTKIKL